ncbi:N-terminal Xaa-Pro-Lys N-methyltransferase 1-B-like [Mizuhopecten yessoensis]|uniref:N-terminal Xaa-Pro-Lys N-methyltransferase 1-B-like n=1 Tax=Mizuhopecten yessoensis TaxID=6573 RepID=UPI000B45F33B|nr:N-terminal Xaa-Pro-Lys N-methyltransferase 1-B-like [Mizuhopecten yessoensis]
MASEVKDEKKFYDDAESYWKNVPSTIDGMLGGFGQISVTDINGSRAFLRPLLTTGGGSSGTKKAIDCGAGIGRITKRLLLPMFDSVDMVELNQGFLDGAPKHIGEEFKRIGKCYCCGLQDFTPDKGKYDVIWIQWVTGHLTDDHFVQFLQRCQDGLCENGVVVLKDNCSPEKVFDATDSSYMRTTDETLELIVKSGLKLLQSQKQKGFPKAIYDVIMFALQ